ncbi:MAG: PQQ-dependent sugar dehydrogenase, partial [Patescibacteria group bacterium]
MPERKFKDFFRFTAFQILAWVIVSIFLSKSAFAALPADFQKTQIIGSGLDGPSGFDIAPDGRIFILERTGKVKIHKNGSLLATPFINLPSLATGDRGLIGIAFDPDFASNHWVYFYYTGTDALNHLVRFDASNDIASGNSVEIYRTTFPSTELHVGGTIQFGNDGKLYLSIGDNGNAPNAQSLDNPFGKILRLNKDGSIPSDNPFVGQSGKIPEIWAYGLRNPFRFQFDSETGRLYEGDVGNNTWEEINFIQKGKNYGWPTCEGPQNTGVGTCTSSSFTYPTYAYTHSELSSAVAGGPVYRKTLFPPEYRGNLFFGDYARGFIRRLTLDSSGNSNGNFDFDTSAGSVVDLKVAPDGSLYYITYIPGRLHRISYSSSNQTPIANSSADIMKGPTPLTVHFSSSGSFDPDGTPLSYNWDFGDGSSSNSADPTKTYQNSGTYTVELIVSDGTNPSQAVPLTIQVGVPPVVYINTPSNNSLYRAGDTIFWSGSGTDGAGFDLPDSAFFTEVIFHHDTHIHPFLGPIQEKSGQFTIPVIGEASPNTWFEIKLTGTDSNSLSTSQSTFIYPQKVNLTFNTSPSGLQILLDGGPISTPQTIQHVIGFQRQLSAVATQAFSGKTYSLSSWSDGGALTHTISTPSSNTVYTATFSEASSFNAEYFNNQTLTGTPTLTRADQTINFNWGGGSPDATINTDNFSVRWTKTQSFAAGSHIFTATADDGIRLWVDNQLVIDKWIDQGETAYNASVILTNGNHDIKMEYYENGGGAVAELSWITDSTTPPPPPPPTPPPSPSGNGDGLLGEYFNNKDLTASILNRIDSIINFDWGYDSPSPQIDSETFSARWTGQIMPQFSELYTFYTMSDDGIRLWVNNQLIIDKWIDQGTEWLGTISLTAGQKYDIKIEYYENLVTAELKLLWSSASTPKQIIPQSSLFSTVGSPPP